MKPDISRPARKGLLALIGAFLVGGGLLAAIWYFADVDGAAQRAEQAAKASPQKGREDLRRRIAAQTAANQGLRGTISELKQWAGYRVAPEFVVPAGHPQPGQFFNERFLAVRDGLRQKARDRSIDFVEDLGFPRREDVPPDAEAPFLLRMLQLTEKAVGIALDARDRVEWFQITHAGAAVTTGPANRPPLLREYPLTLSVRGPLIAILDILHRLSQVDAGGKDFPLILRRLTITSENTKARDEVRQLVATFELAAMEFVPDSERGDKGDRPASSSTASAVRAGFARP